MLLLFSARAALQTAPPMCPLFTTDLFHWWFKCRGNKSIIKPLSTTKKRISKYCDIKHHPLEFYGTAWPCPISLNMNSWESSATPCRQGEQELPEKIKFSLMIFFSLLNPNITNWSLIRASVRQTTANDLQSNPLLTSTTADLHLIPKSKYDKKRLAQAVEHGSARVQRRMISRPTDNTRLRLWCNTSKLHLTSAQI